MVNKYELKVQFMTPREDSVDVSIAVSFSQFSGPSICNMQVIVAREENKPLYYYELEAVKKGTLLINDISDELKTAVL